MLNHLGSCKSHQLISSRETHLKSFNIIKIILNHRATNSWYLVNFNWPWKCCIELSCVALEWIRISFIQKKRFYHLCSNFANIERPEWVLIIGWVQVSFLIYYWFSSDANQLLPRLIEPQEKTNYPIRCRQCENRLKIFCSNFLYHFIESKSLIKNIYFLVSPNSLFRSKTTETEDVSILSKNLSFEKMCKLLNFLPFLNSDSNFSDGVSETESGKVLESIAIPKLDWGWCSELNQVDHIEVNF